MTILEEIITIEEICSPRTPTQFLEWFEDKLLDREKKSRSKK